MVQTLLPGFADPVHHAQRTFRAVLDALARPGRKVDLAVLPAAPSPMSPAMAALALTLCDNDTPVWLDAGLYAGGAPDHLRFHCGSPIVESPAQAAFAFIADAAAMPALDRFSQGTAECPERSTTIVLAAPIPSEGPWLRASGPGIDGILSMRDPGVPRDFWAQWGRNAAAYPVGVDVIFVNGSSLLGLPRSVSVEVVPCT